MCRCNSKNPGDLRIRPTEPGQKITILVNGRKVTACKGESVHAALLATGFRTLNRSRTGEPRGMFCGMGICYECLVTINHIPDQRACMTPVKEGMQITLPALTGPDKKSNTNPKGEIN